MPYLPDGTYISDEDLLAQQQAQMAAHTPTSTAGRVLGTNFNFTPWQGGGSLDLGWDQARNIDAGVTFDQDVGFPFVSGYDASMEGMARLGTGGSRSRLGLTAGVKNVPGSLSANPYIDATISDVVKGLTVGAGTDTTPFASYFGDQDSVLPGLGITTTSGGPMDVSYATGVVPGVDFNIGTAGGGNVGVRASGAWEDIGKTARQLWGGITDAVGNIISPAGADASVPEVTVAPSMQGVDYSQALADVGMATVPTVDVTDQLSYDMRYPGFASRVSNMPGPVSTIGEATEGMSAQRKSDMEDAVHHLDAAYGGVTPGLPQAFQQGNTPTNFYDNQKRFVQKWGIGALTTILGNSGNLPADMLNDIIEDALDERDPIGSGLDKSRSEIQDLINNRVFMDAKRSNISKDQMLDSILNQTNTLVALDTTDTGPLAAAAELSQDDEWVEHSIPLTEDKVREMAFQQDTFKDIPAAPAQPAGPSAAEIARQNAINAQMAQEAAARQRQQQQAVAAEQARQAQAAQAAQEATRRSLEKQMQNWQGRDEQDESAMAQIQAALDHIADLQGTGVTSGSTGDRSGEVRDAMRSVGYGGPEWT
jgi:hypothetical protein